MYFYVKYQSNSSLIIEQPTDLPGKQIAATSDTTLPITAYTFTRHPHSIPRLPFSITTDPIEGATTRDRRARHTTSQSTIISNAYTTNDDSPSIRYPSPAQLRQSNLKTKKKYKPVAQKVRGIIGEMPEKFRVIRNIVGDPLENMPILSPNPPP